MESDLKVLVRLLKLVLRKRRGKYLGELLEAPFVIFTRVVTREVSGRDIRDRFGVDAYDLWGI